MEAGIWKLQTDVDIARQAKAERIAADEANPKAKAERDVAILAAAAVEAADTAKNAKASRLLAIWPQKKASTAAAKELNKLRGQAQQKEPRRRRNTTKGNGHNTRL